MNGSGWLPPDFWLFVRQVALLIGIEAAIGVAVQARRRGSVTSRASIWPRGRTWIVVAVAYFAFCGFGPVAFGILVSLITIQAIREVVAVFAAAGWPGSLPLALCGGVAYVVAAVLGGAPATAGVALAFGAAAVGECAMSRSVRRFAATFAAGSYVGIPLALLVALRRADAGFAVVTWTIVVVGVCDVTSMFGGLVLGHRKLLPSVSPSKTVEGTLIGILGALVAGSVLRFAFPERSFVPYYAATIVVALCGIAGDLFASLLKRAAHVKDFGSALPGHGGVMDRIDSLLFATVVVWFFLAAIIAP